MDRQFHFHIYDAAHPPFVGSFAPPAPYFFARPPARGPAGAVPTGGVPA
jgi:hypothetical protein